MGRAATRGLANDSVVAIFLAVGDLGCDILRAGTGNIISLFLRLLDLHANIASTSNARDTRPATNPPTISPALLGPILRINK